MTGGIGSGKSEACGIFEALGAKIFRADAIARELMDTNQALKKRIRRLLGESAYTPNGLLDRKFVARTIFQDESVRARLNDLVHPLVLDKIDEEIQKWTATPVVMAEAALIYEAGAEEMFDYVLVVHAPMEDVIPRVMQRDSVSREEVIGRINAQIPPDTKLQNADFVIHNIGTKEDLKKKCEFIYSILSRIVPEEPEQE